MLHRKPGGDLLLTQDLISENYKVNLLTGIPNFVGSKVLYETNHLNTFWVGLDGLLHLEMFGGTS